MDAQGEDQGHGGLEGSLEEVQISLEGACGTHGCDWEARGVSTSVAQGVSVEGLPTGPSGIHKSLS